MADTKDVNRCSKTLYRGTWSHPGPCTRSGKVQRDGKWFCAAHDPEAVEAKRSVKEAKWDADFKARQANWDWEKAAHALCQGVSTEEMNKLGPGWLDNFLKSRSR